MIIRLLTILSLLGSAVFSVSARAQEQTAADAAAQDRLADEFRRIFSLLGSVWSQEFARGIQQAYPDIELPAILGLSFRDPRDHCDYHIGISGGADPVIPVNQNYFAFSGMYALPLLMHLIGDSRFADAEEVVSYTFDVMDPQMHEFYERCLDSNLASFQVNNPARHFFSSDEEYYSTVQEFATDPAKAALADQLSGGALAFPLFHELAHDLFSHTEGDFSESDERIADEFAMTVFEKGEVPVAFGALGLLVYDGAFEPHSRDRIQLACRLAAIFDRSDPRWRLPALSKFSGAEERAASLNALLSDRYDGICTR